MNYLLIAIGVLLHSVGYVYIATHKRSDFSYGGHHHTWFEGNPILLALSFVMWISSGFLIYFGFTM
ncbi:TPA: hypothetical protein ACGO3A_001303 [Streptococcus suis]